MGKFRSINYAIVTCDACGETTTIEPSREFSGLNCKCNTEKSKQYKTIEVYYDANNQEVELLGVFENGDKEVRGANGSLAYRIPKATFENNFKKKPQKKNIITNLFNSGKITLEEFKNGNESDFNDEQLVLLAKSLGMRGYSQMKRDTLITKLREI